MFSHTTWSAHTGRFSWRKVKPSIWVKRGICSTAPLARRNRAVTAQVFRDADYSAPYDPRELLPSQRKNIAGAFVAPAKDVTALFLSLIHI